MKRVLAFFWAAAVCGCARPKGDFARVEDGRFVLPGGEQTRFVGTNFWYGPMLGSTGEGGDRERLSRELDLMKSLGINNLRVLVGSEGAAVKAKVTPILQPEPGVYNDQVLDGLDWFMAEIAKREMYAVLYLHNSWEWSGGYSQYLQWSGRGQAPIPALDGWPAFMEYVKGYHAVGDDDPAKTLFADHVRHIVSRTNRYTGKKYVDDPAIFSWQIGNEPRAFADENKEIFAAWIHSVAKLIRHLDPGHMISTGSEGMMGTEQDWALWEKIHSYPEIDYANIHIWPFNWTWVGRDNMPDTVEVACDNAQKYIDDHLAIMQKYSKPVVAEEFGFPRDGFVFTPGSPTTLRDRFYGRIFDLLVRDARDGGLFAGCNFWAWGGYGRPSGDDVFWNPGEDYVGDPAQEEQGLNSVFAGDTTCELIARTNSRLAGSSIVARLESTVAEGKTMFGQQDFPFYGVTWFGETGRSDVHDITGRYPAVLGVDLGELELGGPGNLDRVPWDAMRAEIQAQHARGGVTAVSWHPRNPVTGGDAWDVSDKNVVASILPGGTEHTKFTGWLTSVADFLLSTGVPVIFRPWHEHTDSWFWWGRDLCTTGQYVELWRMTVDHLRARGVPMAVAYSPNVGGDYLERWPGDDYVDILGFDAYHFGDNYASDLRAALTEIQAISASKNMPMALTETGREAIPEADWWTATLHATIKDFPVAYVLVWRNAYEKTKVGHFYAPYPGQASEADFRTFAAIPTILFAGEK